MFDYLEWTLEGGKKLIVKHLPSLLAAHGNAKAEFEVAMIGGNQNEIAKAEQKLYAIKRVLSTAYLDSGLVDQER